MASFALAAPCPQRAARAKAPPIQAKLEVGPSQDRFEAEADRVAQSVLSSSGPSTAPAISPLGSGSAARKPLQREDVRPIEKREEDRTEQRKKGLTQILQPKSKASTSLDDLKKATKSSGGKVQAKGNPAARPKKQEDKVQKKALEGASGSIQAKADPRPLEDQAVQKKPAAGTRLQPKADPKPNDEKQKGQRKPAGGALLQAKANPRPAPREDDKKIQKKSLSGTLQRDDVDDDTILETTIQAKRLSGGTLQREVVAANAALEAEEKDEPKTPESAPVQRDAQSADGFTAPSSVESGIAAMQGGGDPLPADVRGHLEPRFGRDLSGVRIHHGSRAGELSSSVQARAFTIGQDIFFGAGQYQPTTSGGRALLAHELTHTIQQQGGSSRAQPARIQRAKKGASDPKSKSNKGAAGKAGETEDPHLFVKKGVGQLQVDETSKAITMDALPVPELDGVPKGMGAGAKPGKADPLPKGDEGWIYKGKTPRGAKTARRQWLDGIGTPGPLKSAIEKNITDSGSGVKVDNKQVGYFRLAKAKATGKNLMLIGNAEQLVQSAEMLIPIWDSKGNGALFDVDHIFELQLGGADDMDNFWLLDQGSNRSSGSTIASRMKTDFLTLITAAETAGYFVEERLGTHVPKWDDIRYGKETAWTIKYKKLRKVDVEGTKQSWTKGQISKGDHLGQLTAMGQAEIMKKGLIYEANPDNVTARFFALPTGGFFRTVDYSKPADVVTTDKLADAAAGTGKGVAKNQFYKGLAVEKGGIKMTPLAEGAQGSGSPAKLGSEPKEKLRSGDIIATISGQPFPASGDITADPIPDIPVKWKPEFGYGGYVDRAWINEKMARLSIKGASPIEVQEAGLTPQGELFANGVIVATKALFPGLRIPIFLRGNDIFIRFPIPTEKLSFGPVRVTEAAIDIGYGLQGLFLGGRAAIVVDHVGQGTVEAKATTSDTILKGEFMVDMDFLKDPSAEFKYTFSTDKLEVTLKTDVDKGKLPGVEGGHVEGTFSRDAISITGTLDLAPPLQGSQLILGYTEKEGIVIAANDIPLPVSKIPGIKDAKLSARASMNPEDGEWRVSGIGSATFSMPPATGTLTVGLDGPRLMITGTAAFQQGIAAGSVNVTATNAELDEAGQPIPDKVADKFSIWGSGQASLKFGILTGTAGLKLNPDGSVIIDGEIALPPTHEVFKKQSYEKKLIHFKPPEFPIWGVSIAGYGIGIMGFVDAKLNFDAYVGPGTLQDTKVKVTFALDKPEEAVVDGTAAFVVPAGAGFTLDIGGGLSARAAVGYVKGRVGLDARLGLVAEARADVGLHWSQMEGLSLAASAHAEARPRFDIGVNASVTAGVDLWVTEVEHTWGPWRQQLGSFGPEMAVGITAPIAWSEKSGLDFSTDKIEIQKPEIDFAGTMKDAFLELV